MPPAFLTPKPSLTEANLPDQSGKVFIVTGASSGYGLLLSTILYQRNAKVYMAARNTKKIDEAIADLRSKFPNSKGDLVPLLLDLSDLSTIKKSADEFLAKESQLNVLWNNAGVMFPPEGARTVQGYEMQLGTNNVGPFLFTKLLYPVLAQTAASAPPNSVRVVWVASDAVAWAPKPAIDFDNMDYRRDESARQKYGRSKSGTILQAVELQRRAKGDGIVSLSLDPGIAATGLQRDMNRFMATAVKLIAGKPITGAYTQLYAGLQSDLTTDTGLSKWITPPGKVSCPRRDLFDDADLAKKYWEWNEEQVKGFL
ncbi:hypothetical protein BJX63DRAFT_409173 [Aspergillus granulosus]|uniref:Short-chain dehydrogenase n=1 Tax=Aspergillus granulosus TaxID=176169 RepID=A0ABR4GZ32_9EURO